MAPSTFKDAYGLPTTAYVMERLAEAMAPGLCNDEAWERRDPGYPAVRSLARGASRLHDDLRENAQRHISMHSRATPDHWDEPCDPQSSSGAREQNMEPDRTDPSLLALQLHNAGMADEPVVATTSSGVTIVFRNDHDAIEHLYLADAEVLTEQCPLLAMALEDSRDGPQLYLEALSADTANPFVNYLQTGSYALSPEGSEHCGVHDDVPTSVLHHCRMYRLGDIWDLPDLRTQAYVNILRQCEFGCSTPDIPIDLCAAIRYIYTNLASHKQLTDALINYCVSCLLRHRLAENAEFRQLAYELRPFHQDLCKNSMQRDYENETAAAIIQLPFEPHRPETYASREDRRSFDDVVFHFHAEDDADRAQRPCKPETNVVLPLRPRDGSCEVVFKQDSSACCEKPLEPVDETLTPKAMSDMDYEMVDRPQCTESDSDDSTDCETGAFVRVAAPGLTEQGCAHAASYYQPGPKDLPCDESDSDWALV